jgi:hypothetical protein
MRVFSQTKAKKKRRTRKGCYGKRKWRDGVIISEKLSAALGISYY